MLLASFWFGFTTPLRSLTLLVKHPRLLGWSAAPVLITLGLYGVAFVKLKAFLTDGIASFATWIGLDPSGWAMASTAFLLQLLALIVISLTFSYGATIMSIPFNDYLAEATEPFSNPPLPKVTTKGISLRMRLMLKDLSKSIAALIAGVLLLALSWVPLVNFLVILLSSLLVCFQFISYPQSRRGQGLWNGATFIVRHVFSCLGFGLAFGALLAIPFFSCFVIPLAVVGGTLLVARAGGSRDLAPLR